MNNELEIWRKAVVVHLMNNHVILLDGIKIRIYVRGEEAGRYSSTLSLTPALDGGQWSTPRSCSFNTGNYLVPILQEGLCPTAGLDGCRKLRHRRYSIPGRSVP